jgi:hypothetical protein
LEYVEHTQLDENRHQLSQVCFWLGTKLGRRVARLD